MNDSLPQSGVYIRISAESDPEKTLQQIRQIAMVINRSSYGKNMHVIEISFGNADKDQAAKLITLVKSLGIVVILRGPLELAKELAADGIILSDKAQIAQARELLGEDGIIGVGCDLGRPEAELILKENVDYVLFGDTNRQALPALDLLLWWSSVTEISSVAGGPVTNDDAKALVRTGATFLDCTDYVLQHPQGVLQAMSNMLYAIDLAAQPAPSSIN